MCELKHSLFLFLWLFLLLLFLLINSIASSEPMERVQWWVHQKWSLAVITTVVGYWHLTWPSWISSLVHFNFCIKIHGGVFSSRKNTEWFEVFSCLCFTELDNLCLVFVALINDWCTWTILEKHIFVEFNSDNFWLTEIAEWGRTPIGRACKHKQWLPWLHTVHYRQLQG